MAKTKTLHPAEQLAEDLAKWGVPTHAFRFAEGIPLLLMKSRRSGYKVWVALHIDAKDTWSRETVQQFIHTNFGAMIGTSLEDIQTRLKDRTFLEHEDRMELADLLTRCPSQQRFTQTEILNAFS